MNNGELLQQILHEITGVKGEMNGFKEEMKSFKEEMLSFKEKTNQRFDNLETKIDKMDKKLESTFNQTEILTEFRTETNHKLDILTAELVGVKSVTKQNAYDIALLKAN